MNSQDTRIPITLLTGFLGAGKTTLLNTLLWQKGFEDAAVFINEFGEVGVDHLLVEKIDEDVVLLDSGCICCSMRGDLPKALRDLFKRAQRKAIPVPKRIVIETTGIADPAPVIYTLLNEHFIAERFRLDGVVTVVAATHGADQIEINGEALRQVVMADRLVISKCDQASAEQITRLTAHLAALNPTAVQLQSSKGSIAAADILDIGLYDPVAKAPDVTTWLAEIRVAEQAELRGLSYSNKRQPAVQPTHTSDVESFVLKFDTPLTYGALSTTLDALLQGHGEHILRIKGLVNIAGEAGPRIVQCVQHTRCPSVRLDAWPDDAVYADRKSRLVFITRKLSEARLRESLADIAKLIAKYGITA
ncbi:MAG TPA: GTP-binding protein [Rhodocyclaceae bacterium]|jgi:G3E family GTPase|nr:GTP-binding protein [Rhodocyclaceae bacterium]